MPRQCRLHSNARRFDVTHFADHDDVGILPHNRAQGRGKGQTNLRLGLNLVDAFQLVFDRILDSNDFTVGRIDLVQRGLQRRTFATAGRTGNEDDAMGRFQNIDETLQ